MEVIHSSEGEVLTSPGVTMYWLRKDAADAPVFSLHILEMQAGASTPSHSHPYDHKVYVLSGQATFRAADGTFSVAEGDTLQVLPNEQYQVFNRGDELLRLLCGIPLSGAATHPITYQAIGHVENEYDEPESPDTLRAAVSRIVLDPALVEGLQGLTPGSKVLVLFNFHLAEGYELLQHPRGDESRPRRGVFGLRSPYRPNGIGVSEVELLAIDGNVLSVRGLDAINGTPVLDIKPA